MRLSTRTVKVIIALFLLTSIGLAFDLADGQIIVGGRQLTVTGTPIRFWIRVAGLPLFVSLLFVGWIVARNQAKADKACDDFLTRRSRAPRFVDSSHQRRSR